MMVAVTVVAEEAFRPLLYMGHALRLRMLPHVVVIVLVKSFHESIAGWMVERGKDQLRPYVQSQAQDFAQNATMREATTEASLVVHLGIARDAQGLPSMDQELTGF